MGSAIFYNVDMTSAQITRGGSNAHWYEVGLKKVTSVKKCGAWTKQGVFRGEGFTKRRVAQGVHPDTGVDLVGSESLSCRPPWTCASVPIKSCAPLLHSPVGTWCSWTRRMAWECALSRCCWR